jgi:hypothetical protein
MKRRRFLGLLAGTGSAAVTSYFFAPLGGWPLFRDKPANDFLGGFCVGLVVGIGFATLLIYCLTGGWKL